jgi:hypothetical protein
MLIKIHDAREHRGSKLTFDLHKQMNLNVSTTAHENFVKSWLMLCWFPSFLTKLLKHNDIGQYWKSERSRIKIPAARNLLV